MSAIEARSLVVPFRIFRPGAKVKVWLLPTTKVDEGTPLAALVDFDSYLKCGVQVEPVQELVGAEALADWGSLAREYGVEPKGRLVSFRDLSHYGWGLDRRGGVETAKASYWTVFFAQNIMRGLGVRLIGAEMESLWRDGKGEEVHFPPIVQRLQREAKAYRRIKPLGDISPWVKHEVQTTWQRVDKGLTLDVNRNALKQALKQGNVAQLRRQDDDSES